ncbi:MAG: L,D-transpeptidase [Candidatus Saccharimonadales bacterium]
MKSSSLQSKTIRPGLLAYSFYRSDRRPVNRGQVKQAAKPRVSSRVRGRLVFYALLLLVVVGSIAVFNRSQASQTSGTPAASLLADKTNHCAGNTLQRYVIVSISERHLWACQFGHSVYDSPVITGMEKLVADRTPVGTYHIYAKQTNTTLTGSDSTGNWSDPVSYWMPFLDNQYGTYGFHDATWRSNDAFGRVDPNSSDASHGCVELPLATAKWLYSWAQVGTTVTIAS